jgi:RHH-type transcriptional regulator, rel operon repressor / antitoxin RelB
MRAHAHLRPLGPSHRGTAFYLRELIEQGLDDLENAYLGAAALEAHRRSGEAAIPLAVLMQDLSLED